MQKSYCYTPGVSVGVGVRVGVRVGVHMQNVRANVKVLKFKSFCIISCILTLLVILIKPLQQKLTTGAHPVTVAPLVYWRLERVMGGSPPPPPPPTHPQPRGFSPFQVGPQRFWLGLCGAPKISVLRGSHCTVRVSIREFRISVRFVLYINCAFKRTMVEV